MKNIFSWIEENKQQFEGDGPRTMAQEPRNMADGGRIGLKPGGIVEPGVMYYGQKKSEAHKKAMSETKQKKGFKRYITSLDNYEGERKDIKKYNLKEWKALDASQKNQAMKKVEMKLEPGAYEGEFAAKTEEQKEFRRKEQKRRYAESEIRREKAITKASKRYYETGGAKAQYKKDMKKTKGKATLAKEKNRLLKYMEQSAFKHKNPKYKQILNADGFFVGVKDLSHKIDGQYKTYVPFEQYETRYKTKKNYLPITKHRDYKNFETFFNTAKRFNFEAPDRLLGSYFQKYNRVPSYSEIYNFFERDPRSKPRAYQQNALEHHHRALMANSPTRNLQLTLFDRNNAATSILKGYDNPDHKLYKNLEAVDKELKKLKVRVKVGGKMLGIGEMLPEESLSDAKKQTVKIFREELKKVGTEKSRWGSQKELFDDMAKKLKLLCPKGSASGGRIGFADGPATVTCGKNRLNQIIKSGNIEGLPGEEQKLVRQILNQGKGFLKGTGRFALGILNPKNFMSVRALLGPEAAAFLGVWEGAVITNDVLRHNLPLGQALAKNWMTGWAKKNTFLEEQIGDMRKNNFITTPGSERAAQSIGLMEDVNRAYSKLNTIVTSGFDMPQTKRIQEQQAKIEELEKKYWDFTTSKEGMDEDQFEKDLNEYEAHQGAGYHVPGEVQEDIFGHYVKGDPEADEPGKIRVNEYGYRKVAPFKAPKLEPRVIKKTTERGRGGVKLDWTTPSYKTMKETPLSKEYMDKEQERVRKLGYIHPVGGELPQWYKDQLQTEYRLKQAFHQSQPGLRGTQFAGGGLANLTTTVAPDSGPVSQGPKGLAYLKKYGNYS